MAKTVGLTKDAGYQIGARRTFDVSTQEAWDWLISAEGVRLWLGDAPDLRWKEGAQYKTRDGVQGEIRVVNPGSHVRLTWQPKGWDQPAWIQVRVMPSGRKSVIAFHQDHLQNADVRAEMRERWHTVLDRIEEHFNR